MRKTASRAAAASTAGRAALEIRLGETRLHLRPLIRDPLLEDGSRGRVDNRKVRNKVGTIRLEGTALAGRRVFGLRQHDRLRVRRDAEKRQPGNDTDHPGNEQAAMESACDKTSHHLQNVRGVGQSCQEAALRGNHESNRGPAPARRKGALTRDSRFTGLHASGIERRSRGERSRWCCFTRCVQQPAVRPSPRSPPRRRDASRSSHSGIPSPVLEETSMIGIPGRTVCTFR